MTDAKVTPLNPPIGNPVKPAGYKPKPMAKPNIVPLASLDPDEADDKEQARYEAAIKEDSAKMTAFGDAFKKLCDQHNVNDVFLIAGSHPRGYGDVAQAFGTTAILNSGKVSSLLSLGSRAGTEVSNLFNYVNSALAQTEQTMKEQGLTEEDMHNA